MQNSKKFEVNAEVQMASETKPKTKPETKPESEAKELWVEKYRPKRLEEVIAPKDVIQKVRLWAKKWEEGIPQKPLLLAGPPGVGKTSLAHAIAGSFGWEVVELNASDQRNWQVIYRIVGESAFNETISDEGEFYSSKEGKLKLIILDEVDNIHKKEDLGGEGALIRILRKKPKQPIILTANDPYNLSAELRSLCEMIQFKRLDRRRVVAVLERICTREGIKADRRALEEIAINAGGDLRAAINDLQAIAEGKKEIRLEDVVTAKRTQETDVFKVMQKIFKTKIPAYSDVMLLDESPEDFIMWIDENVPLEYEGEELAEAYEWLSRADVFLGRVRRRQYYRLWKYASYLMSCGVQQSKKEPRRGFTRYRRPSIWQLLFQSKSRREKLRNVLSKIGKYSHMSRRKAVEMLPIIKLLLNQSVEIAASVAAFYDFSQDDLEFLLGDEKKAKEIIEYIRQHNLHRIEDEEMFWKELERRMEEEVTEGKESAEEEKGEEKKAKRRVKEKEEKAEEEEEKEKEGSRKKRKKKRSEKEETKSKGKNATLDSFF